MMRQVMQVMRLIMQRSSAARRYMKLAALPLMLTVVVTVLALAVRGPAVCSVEASHDLGDFCYRTSITIAKGTSGDLDDYPVAVSLNLRSFVESSQLGKYGWDARAVTPGNITTHAMAQDIESGDSTSTTFLQADVLGSSSVTYQLYSGNASMKRNQGMLFHQGSGADSVTVTSHADFDITDDLDIIVEASATDPDQTGSLVDRLSGNDGYRAHVTATGSGKLAFTVGDGSTTKSLEVDWDGGQETVRFRFDAGAASDMDIAFLQDDGTYDSQGSFNSGFASISATSTDVIIGGGFDGIIYEAAVVDSAGVVERWGFNPVELAQTDAGDSGDSWGYEGTVEGTATGHDGTYSLIHDQSNLTITLGPTALNFSPAATEAPDDAPDLVGDLGGSNFAERADEVWRGFGGFGDAVELAVDNSAMAGESFRFMLTVIFGTLAGGIGWQMGRKAGNEQWARWFFVGGMIITLGISAQIGFILPWWAFIGGLVTFIGGLASMRFSI